MKKIALIVSSIFLFSTIITTAFANTFADVDDNETYKTGIEFLAEMKIVNGNPDGTYKPEKVLNRAEMIKIIAEGAAKYFDWSADTFNAYGNQKCFTDVQTNQWYTKYICYGKEKGWVKGYDDGTFKPNQEVSFVEGLKITYMGFDLGYTEDATVWYKNAVEKASEKNFIPFTIKSFDAGFKRNEMADLVTRIIKSNESEDEFNTYLGSHADIVVTYENIEKGEDLSEMEDVEIGPGESEEDDSDDATTAADTSASQTYTVEMTASMFSPSPLTIKAGDTVTFSNTGTNARWPASASHPTHTVYPGSDINKCFNGEKDGIFDACGPIEAGQSWSFTFNEKGTWNYHDHLSPGTFGQIVVE